MHQGSVKEEGGAEHACHSCVMNVTRMSSALGFPKATMEILVLRHLASLAKDSV